MIRRIDLIDLFARREKATNSPEATPGIVRMLALILVMQKANMSIYKSIIAARVFVKGPFRAFIDSAIRGVILGMTSSIDKAIRQEKRKLPIELDWASSALEEIILAAEEPDEKSREIILNRAFSSALISYQHYIRESLCSLRIPITTIFAMGIVLPIILATMLPMWNLTSPEFATSEFSEPVSVIEGNAISAMSSISNIVNAIILLFPILCILFTRLLLGNRASILGIRDPSFSLRTILLFLSFLSAGFFFLSYIFGLKLSFWGLGIIMIICGYGLDFLLSNKISTRENHKDLIHDYYRLSIMSSRMTMGEHFVRAYALTDSQSEMTKKIMWNSLQPRILADPSAIEADKEMILLISEAAEKDSQLASQMIRQLAGHMNQLLNMQMESRMDLKPISQSIAVATLFLSPFVLGLVSGFDAIGLFFNGSQESYQPLGNLFLVFNFEMTIAGLYINDNIGLKKMSKIDIHRPISAIAISSLIFILSQLLSDLIFS